MNTSHAPIVPLKNQEGIFAVQGPLSGNNSQLALSSKIKKKKAKQLIANFSCRVSTQAVQLPEILPSSLP